MKRWRLRSLLRAGTEALVSVGLVLVFFSMFLILLSVGFPKGSSLKSLMQESGLPRFGDRPVDEIELEGTGGGVVATLSQTFRKVKHKPADYLVWEDSPVGLPLENRHSVQTLSRSGATIAFNTQNELTLGENSLVVVKHEDRDLVTRADRAAMVVLEGELRGRISAGQHDSLEVEIVTGTDSRLRPRRTGGTTSFAMSVTKEGESTVSVFEGAAEFSAGDRTVVVDANQAVTIDASGQIGKIIELPPAPSLESPAPGAMYTYRAQPPRITFAWGGLPEIDGYRFELSRDPEFHDLVHAARIDSSRFTHGNLGSGSYYWRVSGLRQKATGHPSRLGQLRVVQDREAPMLRVALPEAVVESDRLSIAGTTEPGTRIFVASEPVAVSSTGTFEHILRLQRGINIVVIEAVDAAGNTAYQSQLVHARY